MRLSLMLLGADTLLAKVDVCAPAAAGQVLPLANGAANGATLQQVRNNVTRVFPPGVFGFVLFADFPKFIMGHHNPLLAHLLNN